MTDFDPAQLLEMMQRDPTAGRQALQDALRARAGGDPRLAMLMEMASRAQEPPDAPSPRDPSRAQRIRARIQDMREELVELHQRNDDLADALGACSVCWGRAPHCYACRGRGKPGWRTPDPELFDELVAPALTKRGER